MNKVNFRQIMIHFIATWLFMFAFQSFLSLHETKIINIFRTVDHAGIFFEFDKQQMTAGDWVNFTIWTNVGKTVGLLIAFIISLIISIKNKWPWVNSLLVMLLAYGLAWTEYPGLHLLQNIYYLKELNFIPIVLLLWSVGSIFAFLGIITFFHHKTNQFIQDWNKNALTHSD